MSTIPRGEIILECATAVAACWNYYSDIPLTKETVENIAYHLTDYLPRVVSTDHWLEYANEYKEYVESQE
jgi:hypothetical protein